MDLVNYSKVKIYLDENGTKNVCKYMEHLRYMW